MNSSEKVLLGIDPGTVITGYALIKKEKSTYIPLDFGCITPPKKDPLSNRYHIIFQSLCHLIEQHRPHEVATETPFVYENPQTAIKLGGALACVMIAAKKYSLPIFGYEPRKVKRGITGTGSATKEDVAMFIQASLGLQSHQFRSDVTDAISIALYHAMHADMNLGKNTEL